MNNANTNAKTKGHAVMYSDKILPALSLIKGKIFTNTTAISEDAKKKFNDAWKNTTVDCDTDNASRLKVEESVMLH